MIEAVHELMEHYGNDTSDELSVITETIDQTQEWLVETSEGGGFKLYKFTLSAKLNPI